MTEGIHWLGHAGFRIDGEKTIYIDPYKIRGGPKADIVCISHPHYDHCSLSAIERIQTEGTVIVTCEACAGKFKGRARVLKAGDSVTIEGVTIEGVPAYNIGKPFHPRGEGGLGFVIVTGGRRVYFAGDTDLIPEMAAVKADVALLPVSGVYVMSADEAAEAAGRIRPGLAIPMHYGTIVGSRSDAARFKECCPVPVEILEKEEG
ncbi:MAG: MBL fold metallo-hydrolase [Candidatus Aureabacteria bacterium]|nr:MBL fold metallo-hydrolase [Candidatus Auribacterota bacterium]